MTEGDTFNRKVITEKAQEVLAEYSGGITLRQLYYRLVAQGMINDVLHYKRVVSAMTEARWQDVVSMEAFIDRERAMYGETKAEVKDLDGEVENAKQQLEAWMNSYHLNKWSNQENYVEVWIEKKALQGVFEEPCDELGVGLAPCKGYPSITFLHEASERFDSIADDKEKTILYFGDYDPSGEDIPNSIKANLERMGCSVEVKRIAQPRPNPKARAAISASKINGQPHEELGRERGSRIGCSRAKDAQDHVREGNSGLFRQRPLR
jgi:hypothetical protein